MDRRTTPALAAVFALAALLALPGLPARAVDGRTAYLVRDLYPGEAYESVITLEPAATLGNRVLLIAGDPASGRELWVTDGTGVGTRLLVDACPGSCSSVIRVLGTLGGQTIWAAAPTDGFGASSRSWRLWITDGTRAGTRPLTEPGALPDDPEDATFALAGGRFFFAGCTTADSCGLWTTDGTPEETGPVPGLASTRGRPSQLTAVGDRVFFNTFNELWVSDGSAAGSARLKSFAQPGLPEALTAAGGRLFLIADGGQGRELWTSDGTAAGTRALTQLAPANPFPATEGSFDPWIFKVAGHLVYFIVNDVLHEDEMWRSDGTSTGTFALTDFDFHQPFGDDFDYGFFAVVGDRFLFQATDGFEDRALWVTTGTRESTRPLADECPTCPLPRAGGGPGLISTGTRLLFPGALPGDTRGGIWTSDGTARGTRPLDCGGPCGNLFSDPVAGSGGMYFNTTSRSGLDLWFTDGTAAGTRRLTAFAQGGPDAAQVRYSLPVRTPDGRFFFNVYRRSASFPDLWISRGTPATSQLFLSAARLVQNGTPQDLRPFGDRLFFHACGPEEIGIWETAGSAASTVPAWTLASSYCDSSSAPYGLTAAGDTMFFFSRAGSERDQLWRTTGPGTDVRLTDFTSGRAIVYGQPAVLGGQIYFEVHTDSPYQSEIWRSDGTPQGTVKAFEIAGGRLEHMTVVGNELYLLVANVTQRIWRSDGTQSGTREILNAGSGFLDFFYEGDELLFARLGSRVFFTALGSNGKPEIWETDGTAAGTHRVAELPQRLDRGVQSWGLTAHQGALYFFSLQGGRAELWRSDGTQFGTVLLRAFEDPGFYRRERGLVPFAGALYFAADGGQEGEELWKTDGTPAGTVLVRDIAPEGEGSSPSSFAVAGNRLYFAATEAVHGRELWETDGTAAGTRLVQDIAPLASSSAPSDLTVAGGRLYFAADDGLAGRELWALPLAGTSAGTGCQPAPTHLCLGNGRFQAEIAWRDFEGNTGAGMAVPLTGDTGYFWFFDPANVEAVVKVLDGQGLNGHQWVFYGALSNVEYSLTVTDTQTGLARRYLNPSGVFASVGDTAGFGPNGAYSTAPVVTTTAAASVPGPAEAGVDPAAATGSCQAGPQRLCLNGGRFAVEVSWKDFQGNTGRGQAVALSGDTGYFWFFDAANVELVTKALDGTALNGKFWFFYGALSNVEYRITVTDTTTGQTKTYTNPAGRFASVGDTAAF